MSVWMVACHLLAKHLATGERLDVLLETLPSQMSANDRRRCRHLLYGAVRHHDLLEAVIAAHVPRQPRPKLRAVLLMGAFDLMEHPEEAASIVHHWVGCAREFTSSGEARLVNAVLRRAPATLGSALAETSMEPAALARRHSHPVWLVERWLARFGPDATRRLLEWNQQPAAVHARVSVRLAGEEAASLPDFFQPVQWPGFYRLDRLDWGVVEELLREGRIYLQDPATSLAPRLLAIAPGEVVLDVCAAPGGKTFQLAEAAGPEGRVVAVDLPGARLERFRRNLAARPLLPIQIAGLDATKLLAADLAATGLPVDFDAVLVDAPCSNTGVLRHRVDVKRRLQPSDVDGLAGLQLAILRQAAALTRPGGRLVYSTCSLEQEENEEVVSRFLAEATDWTLERAEHSRPWESGCDGAAAFLLKRSRNSSLPPGAGVN